MSRVDLGYFANFKRSDTLLMEGDADGLRELARVLRLLQSGRGSAAVIQVDALPFVQSHHGVRLTAKRSLRDLVTRAEASSHSFTWERTETGWQDAADKLEVLVRCSEGHHYFDTAQDELMVEVAKGEYGNDWWSRHG